MLLALALAWALVLVNGTLVLKARALVLVTRKLELGQAAARLVLQAQSQCCRLEKQSSWEGELAPLVWARHQSPI